jgi:guanylate kinase
VKQKLPDTVAIFILPPSRETLSQRLTDRGTDNNEIIERRMRDADNEMSHYSDAEYLLINDDFEQALHDLECVIHSQTLKLERQKLKNRDLIASIKQETV